MATLNLLNLSRRKQDERKSTNRLLAERTTKVARERGKNTYAFGGFRDRNTQSIFIPAHGMFKGWMRENRRCSFNKNR